MTQTEDSMETMGLISVHCLLQLVWMKVLGWWKPEVTCNLWENCGVVNYLGKWAKVHKTLAKWHFELCNEGYATLAWLVDKMLLYSAHLLQGDTVLHGILYWPYCILSLAGIRCVIDKQLLDISNTTATLLTLANNLLKPPYE